MDTATATAAVGALPALEAVCHHSVDAFVEVHGRVLAYTPVSVRDFVEFWDALAERLGTVAPMPRSMGDRLHAGYPIAAGLAGFMADFGDTYYGMADGARDVGAGYVLTQPHDVMREFDPRTNEGWANVGAGNNNQPMGAALAAELSDAARTVFGYEPENPLDLETWYRAWPYALDRMAEQVSTGRTLTAAWFPGAAEIPDAFYMAMRNAYVAARDEAHVMLEGYRTLQYEDLMRIYNQRVNEELADVSA